jgi:hypothetical protein
MFVAECSSRNNSSALIPGRRPWECVHRDHQRSRAVESQRRQIRILVIVELCGPKLNTTAISLSHPMYPEQNASGLRGRAPESFVMDGCDTRRSCCSRRLCKRQIPVSGCDLKGTRMACDFRGSGTGSSEQQVLFVVKYARLDPDGALTRKLQFFQKMLKYGLSTATTIAVYEAGFSDRALAVDLSSSLNPVAEQRHDVVTAIREQRESVTTILRKYPSYFSHIANNML